MSSFAPPRPGFRLHDVSYALDQCQILYRGAVTLVLTPDRRFALLGRGAAQLLTAGDARDWLVAHGEADLVEEFPELFRRPAIAPSARPAEPYLFPLQ